MHPLIKVYLNLQRITLNLHRVTIQPHYTQLIEAYSKNTEFLYELEASISVPEFLVGFYYERNIRMLCIYLWDNTLHEYHGCCLRHI